MDGGVLVEPVWGGRSFGWIEVERAEERDGEGGGRWTFLLAGGRRARLSTRGLGEGDRATLRDLVREHLGDRVVHEERAGRSEATP